MIQDKMKKLQIALPEDINLKLKIYKVKYKFQTMSIAISKILEEKFEADELKENEKMIKLNQENIKLKEKLENYEKGL